MRRALPLTEPARRAVAATATATAAARRRATAPYTSSATAAATRPAAMALSAYSGNPDRFVMAMDRFFDELEPRWARLAPAAASAVGPTGGKLASWRPTCDVRETDKEFLIQAEVPGAKKDDIKIELDGNNLRLSGEVKDEKTTKSDTYYHSERSFGRFTRTFAMPETAELDHIKAEYQDGVLHVSIPKRAKQEPAKRIINVQ